MTSGSVVQILAADDGFGPPAFGHNLITEPVDQQGRAIAAKLNPVIRSRASRRKARSMTTGIAQEEIGKLEKRLGGVRRLARILDYKFPAGRDHRARGFYFHGPEHDIDQMNSPGQQHPTGVVP